MRMPANNTTCGCSLSGVRFPAPPYAYPARTITLGAIPALLMTPLATLASVFALALIGGRKR